MLKVIEEKVGYPVACACVLVACVVVCASIGLVLGFVAWGTHRPFTKLVERYVPGFDTRDTEMIEKCKDQ